MKTFRDDDLRAARETPPGEKLRQALQLMEMGLAMQRRKFQRAAPEATAERIDEQMLAWMSAAR